MNGYDAQDAINTPPHGDATVSVLDYADGQAKAFRQGQEQPPAAAPGVDLATAIRNCCEAEKADPDHPDTICISASDLTTIMQQCVIDASPNGGSDTQSWRLLVQGEKIQSGDQGLLSDCVTWAEIAGWEVGLPYNPAFFVPMRRMQATSAAVKP